MPSDSKKIQALRSSCTLNRHPEKVRHASFVKSEFFDPHDLVQLKYETIRSVEIDGNPIAKAAVAFGLSRPTIYEAQESFRRQGIEGLLPQKRGPKKPRKLTPAVSQHLEELFLNEPHLKTAELVLRIQEGFGIILHPRTVEKVRKKKGFQMP